MHKRRATSKPKDYQTDNSNILKFPEKLFYPDICPSNQRPLNTRENLKYLLDRYKIKVCWNIMLRNREITIPHTNNFVDEKENADLGDIYHIATINNMPTSKLDDHLNSIAWLNTYHPIIEMIKANPWDKTSRIDEFIATLKTPNPEKSKIIIKRWLISAIAAAYSVNGFAAHGVLTLQGKQGIGKTTWIKNLDPINCKAVTEGLTLDPKDKDSMIRATSCWIGELSELDGTFKKSHIAPIKAFITNVVDIIRCPFARKNTQFFRRSVYAATVNEKEFLVDDTGNRRWWTIEIESINNNHSIDMKQLWAEIYDIWKNGEQSWLTPKEEEILNNSNEAHEKVDPFFEMLHLHYDMECPARRWAMPVQILQEIGIKTPGISETIRMGKALVKFTNNTKKFVRGRPHYEVPFFLNRTSPYIL